MNLETLGDITHFLTNNQRTRYASLASFVLLVFDYAITIAPEVNLVWFKPWTWSKVLFLWNRYGTFVILLFDTIVVLGGGPTDTAERTVIILVRIAAMYSQDKRIIYPVVFLFFAQAIGMAAIIGMSFAKIKATHEPVPGFRICALLGVPQGMYIYWATNLAFESILFGLAIVKAYQHVSRQQGLRASWSGPRILSVLVRDSILYFLVIFVTYVINLVSWSTGGSGIYQLAIALAIALRASMGSRLLLNVREAYYSHNIISENMLSTMQWQPRNTDCVAMDSFHVANRPASTILGTLPELERDYEPEESLPGPSTVTSSSQTKSRARVTFEPPYTP
ncbi:hypothetical protein RSOLAG22IIIB_01605 [Rhizoctonia solani]|uniref:DUF6533 domain-containing protein n=1 Tax=Rhizoctonia solani TaxID=456999 RepID=A0A0K6G922_9AGAM|nr:unnamed protein product [Rhizoctonia solani]CUA74970.1 hypothetical protein RSOLAG22IIIB_01605 [Rhizoctonia solani]